MTNAELKPSELEAKVTDYFAAPNTYFWCWEENGQVLSWQQGFRETICFRDELTSLLHELAPFGLPRLGAILLLLSACRTPWVKDDQRYKVLVSMFSRISQLDPDAISPTLQEALLDTHTFLCRISTLPAELRTGAARATLLNTLFEQDMTKMNAALSEQSLFLFNSGSMDWQIFNQPHDLIASHIYYDIISLHRAFKLNTDFQGLLQKLRTGIEEIPLAPEPELPDDDTGNLLSDLAHHQQTAGIANLAKHIIAALNIPMHTHGASDQSFGGVSDITNRGNFDRLLLSELAQDDEALMARLANNEALYLRREELPHDAQRLRVILVDTTLRMWGMPRIFAVASAIAVALNNKSKATVLAYTLAGDRFYPADITTRAGVVAMLEQLHPDLGCENALAAYMRSVPRGQQAEYFFITDEDTIAGQHFQRLLPELAVMPDFMASVHRNGRLQYYSLYNGHRKPLNEAKFDLGELLAARIQTAGESAIQKGETPAFLLQQTPPLLLPSNNIRIAFSPGPGELLAITYNWRVMYWYNGDKGGTEFLKTIEEGHYTFGSRKTQDAFVVYLLVTRCKDSIPRLYAFATVNGSANVTQLPEILNPSTLTVFEKDRFHVGLDKGAHAVTTAGVMTSSHYTTSQLTNMATAQNDRDQLTRRSKKVVNNGYTVFTNIVDIRIHKGGIILDSRLLTVSKNGELSFEPFRQLAPNIKRILERGVSVVAKSRTERKFPGQYPQLKFTSFSWADGSELVADPRGLIHLRSSDKSIPDISIITIMGQPTACWASDGRTAGTVYFTREPNTDMHTFYQEYIQRFIDTIR